MLQFVQTVDVQALQNGEHLSRIIKRSDSPQDSLLEISSVVHKTVSEKVVPV